MDLTVGLVDYGSGNFASVWSAFEKHNCNIKIIRCAEDFKRCTHIVLPGVGAFSSAMEKLYKLGLVDSLCAIAHGGEVPLLGICVGMQVMAEAGDEFIHTDGLKFISGNVEKFNFSSIDSVLSLPHIGWNDVIPHSNSRLFRGLDPADTNFYFVHSYRLQSHDSSAVFSYADYGCKFIAAFEKENVFGVQFHPEKSQRNGYQLISNFLEVA